MNYRMITYILGWILLFQAGFLLVPTVTALAYGEEAIKGFLLTMAICLAIGSLPILRKPKKTELRARDGFVIVSLCWILLTVSGALPFMFVDLGAANEINYFDALFEAASGFTTTGSSIMTDVEILPRSINIWRCFTHWVGGMGVLVFIMAFLPLSGGRNMHMMKAESPGPSVSKLVPRVRTTALLLYSIYFVLTVVMFIVYLIGGMPVFEALCTSFGTAGTGGFSFYNDGMNRFSPFLQVMIGTFMLIFSINFESYFLLIKRKWRDALTTEVITFILIVASAVGIITWSLRDTYGTVWEGLRHAYFTVASLISTTGYATANYDLWPELGKATLMMLFFIGACAGSTGGGVKVSRLVILFKSIAREISNAIHPKQVKKITVDGKPVEQSTVNSVFIFFACYIIFFGFSVLIVSLDGADFITNFSAVATALGNVGPGFARVGPTGNFAFFSNLSKLVLTFDMLAGRLELIPMLVLFSPKTWKK
ncbi:MAG: TrkH family potassium uptake protein [Clostridia bacterium]|nr:TrkH family potassium uptake protein [Clostridia bacterium]